MTRKRIHLKRILMTIPAAGLVMAVLYPVFANPFEASKERARQSQCLSNLKQVGIAVTMYYTDADGLMPSSALRTKSKKWNGDEFIAYAMYKNAPKGGETMYKTIRPYLKNQNALWCPSDSVDRSQPHARVSYYYKAAIDRSCFDGKGREGDFEAPADQVMFWENNSRHYGQASKGVVDGVKLNVVYFDLHVSSQTIRNSGYTADENPPLPIPKSKMGEPAWFNYDIKNGVRSTGTFYDVQKYMDSFPSDWELKHNLQ